MNRHISPILVGFGLLLPQAPALGSSLAPDELFEKSIRPLLSERCWACHGDAVQKGGLKLTGRALLLKGGKSGAAIVPGRPEASVLLRAIEHTGPVKMPPGGRLGPAEIEKVRRWIALGAPWPTQPKHVAAGLTGGMPTPAQRKWWAFQPLRPRPAADSGTEAGAIDREVSAQLARRGLTPSGPADRRTLLRRATFHLTGLPPSPEEATAFLRDAAPDAFERVVDRLLASPAYGQRTARRWLDVVRYADYHDGNPAARDPNCEPVEAYRYRDWVVSALNRDMPFDRFIVHQIAGDLLPDPGGREFYADGLVATTFLTNGAWDRGDADKEKMVSDMVDDQIDTIGKAFLGLTLGCARCHDHKFDPVSQRDYTALAGIFYSTRILQELGAKGGNYTLLRTPLAPAADVARWRDALAKAAEARSKVEALDRMKVPQDDPRRRELVAEHQRLHAAVPPAPPHAEAAREGGTPGGLFPRIGDVPLHIRGSYTRLGEVIPRRMPEFIPGPRPRPITQGSGREVLAEWIASPDNPLTARVIVNRVWQWHFGIGLVRTANNFGLLSERPTHPALLDRLATDFIRDGWSLKRLHRRIMLTEAYQRTSRGSAELMTHDPENRLLGRFSPRRLDAEEIRDATLAAAGRLDLSPGGPATPDLDTPRRSLYVQTARWDRAGFGMLFDAANPDASVELRNTSTVAPQALFLLNHGFIRRASEQLAARVLREGHLDALTRVRRLHELLFARPPGAKELESALTLVGSPSRAGPESWSALAHVLLCSNEFVYVD